MSVLKKGLIIKSEKGGRFVGEGGEELREGFPEVGAEGGGEGGRGGEGGGEGLAGGRDSGVRDEVRESVDGEEDGFFGEVVVVVVVEGCGREFG